MAKESKHVVRFRKDHANVGENVVAWAEGYIGKMMGKGDKKQYNGVLIVTESRAVFYRKGFVGEVLETMPLKNITSVERKSTLGHRIIRLHTSHDFLEFKTFQKEGEAALVAAIESGRNQSNESVVSVSTELDPMEKLKKLAELKDAGVLTDEEFNIKKRQLLAEI